MCWKKQNVLNYFLCFSYFVNLDQCYRTVGQRELGTRRRGYREFCHSTEWTHRPKCSCRRPRPIDPLCPWISRTLVLVAPPIAHFSELGYTVAALDVRGYGRSSKPQEIAAYSIRNLTSDVAAAIDELGNGTAIVFGHDWGAPIVWNTALLYPNKVKAVAGLSVPYIPRGPVAFIEMAKAIYKDRFFYQLYFQKEGAPKRS